MIGILISLDRPATLFLLLCTLGGTIFSHVTNKLCYAYDMASRRAGRIADYVHRVHYLADYAKELRVSRAGEVMDALYDEHVREKNALTKNIIERSQSTPASGACSAQSRTTG